MSTSFQEYWLNVLLAKVFGAVSPNPKINIMTTGKSPEDFGIINQKGLNRKVRTNSHVLFVSHVGAAYIRLR